MAKPRSFRVGLSHFVGFVAIGLLILALLRCLVLGVVPPKRGLFPSVR